MTKEKQTLGKAILETMKISDEINVAVGLTTDREEQLCHQENIAFSEYKETLQAIKDNDEVEMYDGWGDLLVTVPTCQMMYAGNKDLLLDEPRIVDTDKTFNELIHQSQSYFLETKNDMRYFIDAVDCLVDAAYYLDTEKALNYLNAINVSNLSKFPVVGSIDPDKEADLIESKGRYTEVYYEETTIQGKDVYVFKSTYDKQNNESFPNGKYLKALSSFKEVQELLK